MWALPKMYRPLRLALLAASILASPAPLFAQKQPVPAEKTAVKSSVPAPLPGEILSPLGSWDVASGQVELGQGKTMPYCAISNTYRDNGRLEFYGTEGKLAAIKIDFPGRTFRGDQSFSADLKMPGGYASNVKGSVVGTATLILNVKGDQALASALHNGKILYVRIEGQDYPFSLSGINKFNDRLKTCSSAGWGDLIHDYVFKKGPAYGPGDDTAIESETLKILASPPKSDPSIIVEDIPEDVPAQSPATTAPSARAVPSQAMVPGRPRPLIPSSEPSVQPVVPAMPDSAQLATPQPKVLARLSDAAQPMSPPKAGFDELFAAMPAKDVRPPGKLVDPPQLAPKEDVLDLSATSSPGSSASVAGPVQDAQISSQITSTPAPLWRALKGSSLREVLALWSLDNHVELIWNAEEQYRVKDTMSVSSSYENAVETLLKQYEPDILSSGAHRPVGQLYVDPAQNKKVLVIRSQAG